jgi:hypothetical protein
MTEYFRKIDVNLSEIDLESMNSGIEKHRPYNLNFSYNKIIDNKSFLNLKMRLPEEYQKSLSDISYCIIISPFRVLPHRDVSSVNVINYYHKPGKSITKFYKPLIPNLKPHMIDDHVKGMSYHSNEIEVEDQFVAESKDCYILDVSKIHSVEVFEGEDRHFISFSFNKHLL